MPHLSFFSPVGELTVIEEDDALVALEWGRAPGGTETELLKETKRQLDAYFTRKLKRFTLPLLMKGSVFQRGVWDRMIHIAYGETLTYGMVARELDSGPRAVGKEMGAVDGLPRATAYVCVGHTCRLRVTGADALTEQLAAH